MYDNPQRMIKDELAEYPVQFIFDRGGKHPYVKIMKGLQSRKVFYTGTPSCHRALLNIRSEVRRALRELGCEKIGTLGKKIIEATEEAKPMSELQQRILPDLSKTANGSAGVHATKAEPAKTEAEKRKRSQMSHDEVVAITRLLLTKADVDEEKRLVTYHQGWSDGRIHELLKAAPGRDHLQLYTVVEFRREKFGDTQQEIDTLHATRVANAARASAAKNDKAWQTEVDALKARIEILEGAILGPKARV